jgi:hypothetical protein
MEPNTHWTLLCLDGCVATFYEQGQHACVAACQHTATGHRVVLMSPGTYETAIEPYFVTAEVID